MVDDLVNRSSQIGKDFEELPGACSVGSTVVMMGAAVSVHRTGYEIALPLWVAAGDGCLDQNEASKKKKRRTFCLTMIQSTLNHRGLYERAPAVDRNVDHLADRRVVVAGSPSGLAIPLEALELQV